MNIWIDAGHGGHDSGAVGNGYLEKDLTLKVSLILRDLFTKHGHTVQMTRTTDKTVEPNPRAAAVKNSNSDLCISIHFNAGGGVGSETVYNLNASKNIEDLAYKILDNLGSLGLVERRAYTKESSKYKGVDYYFMHRQTKPVPTIIIECAFIDSNDVQFYNTDEKLINIARAIYNAIGGNNMTLEEAKAIVKQKFDLSDETILFLSLYKYGDDLLLKLAK